MGNFFLLCSLSAYGNSYLKNYDIKFELTNKTAEFCKEVKFIYWNKNMSNNEQKIVAENPNSWFKLLKEDHINFLRLEWIPSNDPEVNDWEDVLFANGGGRWLISANKGSFVDIWEAKSEVISSDDEDNNWVVTVGRTTKNWKSQPQNTITLEMCENNLEKSIKDIKAFAENLSLNEFVHKFQKALDSLTDEKSPMLSSYYDDLLPKNIYSLKAEQIVTACQNSWIFTPGPWYDIELETEEKYTQYEKLSENLFSSINSALITAINSIWKH